MKKYTINGSELSDSQKEQLFGLLKSREQDFVPPISERGIKSADENIEDYFQHLLEMKLVLIEIVIETDPADGNSSPEENGTARLAAYLAYEPEHYFPSTGENILYMSSAIVDPAFRGHHFLEEMYESCFEEAGERPVGTRTWSTNGVQLHVLPKLGFQVAERIENDRGPGIDSLYFIRYNTVQN
ncbi:MAG: hypothetical protein E7240_07165 [Lachnospiraceae bacterium]|nr:hypothetical protein [Lachnospiraceae bacterium]